jgi:hypothetical protein
MNHQKDAEQEEGEVRPLCIAEICDSPIEKLLGNDGHPFMNSLKIDLASLVYFPRLTLEEFVNLVAHSRLWAKCREPHKESCLFG